MANKAKNIINSNRGLILEETSLTLSDEKLNGILLHTYEKAVANVSKFNFRNLYKELLTFATTLFLSLFTSDFRSIGQFDSELVKKFVISIMIITAITGSVFAILFFYDKTKSDTEERDKSIEEIIDKYLKK